MGGMGDGREGGRGEGDRRSRHHHPVARENPLPLPMPHTNQQWAREKEAEEGRDSLPCAQDRGDLRLRLDGL